MNYPVRFHQSLSVPVSLFLSTVGFGAFAWFLIISQLVREHPDVGALCYGIAWLVPFLIFLGDLLFRCWTSIGITRSCLTINYIFGKTVIQKSEVKNLGPENLEGYDKGEGERELRIYLHSGKKLRFAKIREGSQQFHGVLQQWLSSP